MIIQLDELETIVRHHHSTLSVLQEKLLELYRENSYLYTILLTNSIEERRQQLNKQNHCRSKLFFYTNITEDESERTSESDFQYIRRILLNKPTIPKYQIASRIVTTVHTDFKEDVDNPLVKARLNKQKKLIQLS